MSNASDLPPTNLPSTGMQAARTLQERATTWPEVVQAQQLVIHTLQESVRQQRDVLNTLAQLKAPAALVDRGRALVDVLFQATRLSLEMEEMQIEESEVASRAVLAALKGENDRVS